MLVKCKSKRNRLVYPTSAEVFRYSAKSPIAQEKRLATSPNDWRGSAIAGRLKNRYFYRHTVGVWAVVHPCWSGYQFRWKPRILSGSCHGGRFLPSPLPRNKEGCKGPTISAHPCILYQKCDDQCVVYKVRAGHWFKNRKISIPTHLRQFNKYFESNFIPKIENCLKICTY